MFRDVADLPSSDLDGVHACQPPPTHSITFFDAEFETAATLRLLLHFIIEGDLCPRARPLSTTSAPSTPALPHPPTTYTLTGVRELVLFLRKWQASSTLSHALLVLERAVASGSVCALRTFIIAAEVGHADLISTLVRKHDAFFTARDEEIEDVAEQGLVGVSVWEPTAWPLSMWTKCPSGYAVALARAWGETRAGSSRVNAFPKAFERWLKEVGV